MHVSLRELDEDSARDIFRLSVADNQQDFVAPNDRSIAEAYFAPNAWFRGIYAEDAAIGFVMLYLDETKPFYYVWRFMIDQRYQGKGYGRDAMELVIEHVRSLPGASELSLSYVPKPGNASPFYSSLGFEETGEKDGDECVMRLTL